jgi:hypothetical protein
MNDCFIKPMSIDRAQLGLHEEFGLQALALAHARCVPGHDSHTASSTGLRFSGYDKSSRKCSFLPGFQSEARRPGPLWPRGMTVERGIRASEAERNRPAHRATRA